MNCSPSNQPRYLLLILFTALALPIFNAASQTFRVAMGSSGNGCNAYMEVYEYDYVTEKPEFPGGDTKLMEFINNTRTYPDDAYAKGIQGRVTCSFVVNTDGSISNIAILKSVEETLNKEAMRIFNCMPSWTPGRHNGIAVPVRVIRSVPFRK